MWFYLFPIFIITIIFVIINWKNRNRNDFWDERGVPCTDEALEAKWGKESIHDVSLRLYNEFKGSSFFGSWSATGDPCLVIRDDFDLIKSVFIKDFDHFSKAHHMVPVYDTMHAATKHEKLILKNLQTAHGDEWKNLR